ncbi:epimerase family protein SDR39U1-like [Drosophila miranda]|uniref:epimerase family protein SDR39U1-like n=1 Tax=Drosophila miranda TaxID=7229 RepID=UPI00143F7C8B|nr:epimerase family protein SDR39U1-like [Drosophila miranda]
MIESIWLPFKLGVGGPLGTGQQIMPWIHMLDLCSLIQHIIEKCESGVFNGVAREIAFASALNRPCIFNVPEFVVQAIFGKERSALLLSGAKIQPKKALASGFQFKYPTAKAACTQLVGK